MFRLTSMFLSQLPKCWASECGIYLFVILGFEPGASCMLSKYSITEALSQAKNLMSLEKKKIYTPVYGLWHSLDRNSHLVLEIQAPVVSL